MFLAGQDVAFVDVDGKADLKIENGDLVADDGLENAVLISLFSDRYVPPSDLPPGVENPRGWWADALLDEEGDRLGSRLWVFQRTGKITFETRNGIRDAVKEALDWLIEAGVASRVEVEAELVENTRIDVTIMVYRPDGVSQFDFLWDAQGLKRG